MAKDIKHKKFGKLTAIKATNKRYGTSIIWECVCDCGNKKECPVNRLTSGDCKSCGCLRKSGIKRGQKIGRYKIIKELDTRTKKGLINFKCKCLECGEIKTLSTSQLKTDSVNKPCIIGKKFSKLLVQSFSHIRNNCKVWNCICDCGNKHKVSTSNLTTGRVKSCGCLKQFPNKNTFAQI